MNKYIFVFYSKVTNKVWMEVFEGSSWTLCCAEVDKISDRYGIEWLTEIDQPEGADTC